LVATSPSWLEVAQRYNGHLPQHSDLYKEEDKMISTVIIAESHAAKKEDTQLNQAIRP
jgi:cytochrome c551/c552